MDKGDYYGAQVAFARALVVAQQERDPDLETRILADAANVDLLDGRWQESLEKSIQALALFSPGGTAHVEALARYTAYMSHFALGDLEEARLQASALLPVADRLRDRFWLSLALRANQDAAQAGGDWQTARDLSDRALAVSPMEARSLSSRASLEYETGDFSQGREYVERLIDAMTRTPPGPSPEHGHTALVISVAARISGESGQLDLAEAAAQRILSSPDATGWFTTTARIVMALLSVLRNDVAEAEQQYRALASSKGVMWHFINMSANRALGLLAQTIGRLDEAVTHFDESLAICRKAGFRPELAWSCCDYADMLRERDAERDRAKAIALLDESLAISSELGMRPLMERVLSRREILRA